MAHIKHYSCSFLTFQNLVMTFHFDCASYFASVNLQTNKKLLAAPRMNIPLCCSVVQRGPGKQFTYRPRLQYKNSTLYSYGKKLRKQNEIVIVIREVQCIWRLELVVVRTITAWRGLWRGYLTIRRRWRGQNLNPRHKKPNQMTVCKSGLSKSSKNNVIKFWFW